MGVACILKELGIYAVTDINGVAVLQQVPLGKTELELQILGYENYKKGINVEVNYSLEIRMIETSLALDEVNVVATKNEAGQATSSKIGRQAIDHLQATSLADLMQLLPGQLLKQNSDMTSPEQFYLRTLNSDKNNAFGVSIMVDGIPMSNDVNLNSNESIFLFAEKYTDYHVVVEKMYRFFAHQFDSECYFAVSKEIEDRKNLAEEFKALEGMLEEQFYQPHQHLFFHGEKQEEKKADPAEDSEIMEQITNDIQYKDLPHLRQDFQKLEDKYRVNKQFSDMYVKFVFSGILKELLDQMDGMDEKMLSKRVDRLYRCKNLKDVIAIVDEALQEYEHCIQEQEDGFRSEITKVKSYIYHHYQERNLGAETLSAMVFLSPGYLSAVFKEETGVTMNRFIREVRMEKAKELLETTNMKISGIAKEVGFSNNSYFCRSFREFFGDTPEACRKGTEADEKTNTEAAPSI